MYTVYILDDDPLIISGTIDTIIWEEYGFKVVGFGTDPHIAYDFVLKEKPDLVVCDLKMPSMNGIEFIRKIKKIDSDCEFIMISAFPEFEASRDFFLLGGHDFLVKPVESKFLAITLEKLFEKLYKKRPLIIANNADAGKIDFSLLVDYITKNFNKKHSLKALSNKFHISEGYICNLFAKEYDTTLTAFITQLRMDKAAHFITTTDKSMKEIAILCGYHDYFYFCRVFKNKFAKAPTEYRISHAGED